MLRWQVMLLCPVWQVVGLGADLTVCQVLTQPSVYSERKVTLTAEVVFTREAIFLRDQNCLNGPRTGAYRWMPYIHWEHVRGPGNGPTDGSVEHGSDRKAAESRIATFLGAVMRSGPLAGKSFVSATVSGRFKMKELVVIRTGDGRVVPRGFGHLNQFPAELVIDDVLEWKIIDNPAHR